jgi:hypothetical protein
MRRTLTLIAGAVVLTLTLAACTTAITSARLQFSLSASGNLGYEIDDDGNVTIASRNLRFRNVAGAYGVTLTEYTIAYFDTDGIPLALDVNVQTNTLSIFVPAGIQCTTPDPATGCQVGDPGWRFGPGPEVVSEQGYQLLPGAVAVAHALGGMSLGWYAEIEFTGFDTMNRVFTTEPYRLTITAPD